MRARWDFFQEIGVDRKADPHGVDSGTWLAGFYADDGRWNEAEECMAVCRDAVSTLNPSIVDDNRALEPFLAVEARLAAHRGEIAEALSFAKRALAWIARADEPNTRARTLLAVAEVQLAAGNQAAAEDATAKALALYEKKGNVAAATQLRAAIAV
jgi:tetratricopeptide (TPR) repeat protein